MTDLYVTDLYVTDLYVYVLTALLPLSACMLVLQVNPYNALVLRGVLGAVAAMVYAILGAADVALTEALMGTMLAITLYAVAVRSSLVMRLGVLKDDAIDAQKDPSFSDLINDFRAIFKQHYMRLELVPYPDEAALEQALLDKEVHATCLRSSQSTQTTETQFHTAIRLQRLYDIIESELSSSATSLTYIRLKDLEGKHL